MDTILGLDPIQLLLVLGVGFVAALVTHWIKNRLGGKQ